MQRRETRMAEKGMGDEDLRGQDKVLRIVTKDATTVSNRASHPRDQFLFPF